MGSLPVAQVPQKDSASGYSSSYTGTHSHLNYLPLVGVLLQHTPSLPSLLSLGAHQNRKTPGGTHRVQWGPLPALRAGGHARGAHMYMIIFVNPGG